MSDDYVALRLDGEPPAEAVETLRDAGSVFAVVPVGFLDHAKAGEVLPVLAIEGSDRFEVVTGVVTLRWTASLSEIGGLLEAAGVEVIRNYGSGGMVRSRSEEGPFELAERLSDLDFVTSATVQTISEAAYR